MRILLESQSIDGFADLIKLIMAESYKEIDVVSILGYYGGAWDSPHHRIAVLFADWRPGETGNGGWGLPKARQIKVDSGFRGVLLAPEGLIPMGTIAGLNGERRLYRYKIENIVADLVPLPLPVLEEDSYIWRFEGGRIKQLVLCYPERIFRKPENEWSDPTEISYLQKLIKDRDTNRVYTVRN